MPITLILGSRAQPPSGQCSVLGNYSFFSILLHELGL